MSYDRTTRKNIWCDMEVIGIIREIDNLGRICIPKEIRKTLKLEKEVELLVTSDGLIIRNPNYVILKKEEK